MDWAITYMNTEREAFYTLTCSQQELVGIIIALNNCGARIVTIRYSED